MTLQLVRNGGDLTEFDVRPLNGDISDTATYRALREKIRSGAGAKNFADSYTREDALDEQSWHDWCSPRREHCIIGTFDKKKGNKLVSIIMITAQGPADSLVAEWEATWVEEDYRGSGVAKRAYEEAHRVTMELGYQHAAVFIREDNHHCQTIRESHGFTYLCTNTNQRWEDGSIADANLFMLDLYPDRSVDVNCHGRALRRLERTLEALKGEAPIMREAVNKQISDLHAEMAHSAQIVRYPLAKASLG
jgi:GNAT superfamily N-acetyltransferase